MDSRVVNTFLGVHQKKTPERVFFCKENTLSKSSKCSAFCRKFVGLNLTGKVISLLLSTFFAKALVLD